MRLQSDFLLARGKFGVRSCGLLYLSDGCRIDRRTACLWQDMIGECTILSTPFLYPSISYVNLDNQTHATKVFKAAMAKLQVLGQNTKELIDCSEVSSFGCPCVSCKP